jgi:hypothetical protein
MPFASALYACDQTWWERNKELWRDFAGMKFTWSKQAAQSYGLLHAPGNTGDGLGKDKLHAGGSSTYMAVNLAYFLGAREIYLLGADMQATGGKLHWHPDHKGANPTPDALSKWAHRFVPLYEDLKSIGIPLINCSRETAMTIPRMTLEDVLNAPKPKRILAKQRKT